MGSSPVWVFSLDSKPSEESAPEHNRFPAACEEVVTCGRVFTDASNQSLRFDWSACSLSFGVTGNAKEVWISMDGQENYFNVHVDGDFVTSFYAEEGQQDYCAVKNLSCDATISIVKRTEGKNSSLLASTPTTVFEIVLPLECSLTKPLLTNVCVDGRFRAIEFVGDSDTAGFGNLSAKTELDLGGLLAVAACYQDVEKAWPCLVARAFQADPHVIAVSGCGAKWRCMGADEDNSMRPFYKRIMYSDEAEMTPMPPVDLVVVYLGCNDFDGVLENSDELAHYEFIEGYAELLGMIKERRPGTPILCLLPGQQSAACMATSDRQRAVSDLLHRLIPEAVEDAGGSAKRISCKTNPATHDLTDDSQWGSLWHWSVKGQVMWAHGVVSIISDIMGWQAASGWDKVSYIDDKLVESNRQHGVAELSRLLGFSMSTSITVDTLLDHREAWSQEEKKLDILPNDSILWMWGDVGLVGHYIATKNPLRWSSAKTPAETIAELEQYDGSDADRPVDMVRVRAGYALMGVRFHTVVGAMTALRPQAHQERFAKIAEALRSASSGAAGHNFAVANCLADAAADLLVGRDEQTHRGRRGRIASLQKCFERRCRSESVRG